MENLMVIDANSITYHDRKTIWIRRSMWWDKDDYYVILIDIQDAT
jgi:hypothetical protein